MWVHLFLLILQQLKVICSILRNIFPFFTDFFFFFLFSYMLQVQNLNNIMAFPLENVLKSELRDSRLVSLDFITYGINEILI